MKRVFSLNNSVVVASVLMGLLFTATSFSYGPVGDAPLVGNPPQKKEQRVKVIVSTDGKVTKIDTAFIQHDDSGKIIRGKKIIHPGDDGSFDFFGGPDGDLLLPPPPPVPGQTPVIIHKRVAVDPFAFDTKDESIISYDKKDIGKGLEKITIIRKKQVGQQQEKKVEVRVETSDDPKK